MKFKVLRGACFIGALITIWGVFEPWLVFSGTVEHILVGTINVTGIVFGFGHGILDGSSASVTVWSSEIFSSSSSDFWFGLFPLIGGLLSLILIWKGWLTERPHFYCLLMFCSMSMSIFGCMLTVFWYTPYVFVLVGQITPELVGGAFLYGTNASTSIGFGVYLTIIGTLLSGITYLSAHGSSALRDVVLGREEHEH